MNKEKKAVELPPNAPFELAMLNAYKGGLVETLEESKLFVETWVSNCEAVRIESIEQGYIAEYKKDVYPLLLLMCANVVFLRFGEWESAIDDVGEVGACLGILEAIKDKIHVEKAGGVKSAILRGWKKVQKQKRGGLVLAVDGRERAGLRADTVDNEILDKLFPICEKGELKLYANNVYFGSIRLENELMPLDRSVLFSLIASIQNNKQGRFYYIGEKAFCKAFFGLGDNGVHDEELKLIRDSISRLKGAKFLNINIGIEHNITNRLKYSTEPKGKARNDIIATIPYLPLMEDGKIRRGESVYNAWILKEDFFLESPLVGIAKELNRVYALSVQLVPSGVKRSERLLNSLCYIFGKYIATWSKKQEHPKAINLNIFYQDREGKKADTFRKGKKRFLNSLLQVLHYWESEGLCTFAVGIKKGKTYEYSKATKIKDENGKPRRVPYKLTNYKANELEEMNIEMIRVWEVDKNSSAWSKVELDAESEK